MQITAKYRRSAYLTVKFQCSPLVVLFLSSGLPDNLFIVICDAYVGIRMGRVTSHDDAVTLEPIK